ncbi:hypothetical protein HOU00_gp138 [Caulobacter phage CcrPW]|uniref:Uncharacterized protein n=1 Tax=Caulobacter phage CcrPW TaxID=2283271 RepID=A0A385EDU1_9CAUD|nr:hypothetical protein HOU00_gp138 [Caulobacter phage CcrPW]AXQ68987.1 hypothetical protein CcrPW_gp448 [Caulobacter phage CcrPW]
MTPEAVEEGERLKTEIDRLTNRQELVMEMMKEHQSSVFNLVAQSANDELVEDNRNLATFYYESFLDLTIQIGRLTTRLEALAK